MQDPNTVRVYFYWPKHLLNRIEKAAAEASMKVSPFLAELAAEKVDCWDEYAAFRNTPTTKRKVTSK